MRPTRRKTLLGMGALATGSGAVFSSAAFQSSTQPDSDLRVVVDQNLQFGANPDLDVSGRDDLTDNLGFFNGDSGALNESSGGAFNEGNETNGFDRTIEFGIAYDRNGDGGGNGNYGSDVALNDSDSTTLKPNQAQNIYKFEANRNGSTTQISPEDGENGVSGSSSGVEISNASDQPASLVSAAPGENVTIDVTVDTETYEQKILDASDVDGAAFGFQTDTVQIMEAITVVSQPQP